MVACLSLAATIPPFFVLMKQVHRTFLARAVVKKVNEYIYVKIIEKKQPLAVVKKVDVLAFDTDNLKLPKSSTEGAGDLAVFFDKFFTSF